MGDIVELDVMTHGDIPSEKLLQKAIEGGVTNVVIIGYDPGGKLWFASSDSSCGDVLWLLEAAKRTLFENADAETK